MINEIFFFHTDGQKDRKMFFFNAGKKNFSDDGKSEAVCYAETELR